MKNDAWTLKKTWEKINEKQKLLVHSLQKVTENIFYGRLNCLLNATLGVQWELEVKVLHPLLSTKVLQLTSLQRLGQIRLQIFTDEFYTKLKQQWAENYKNITIW